jgi:sortase A
VFAAATLGAVCVAQAAWIHVKARLAQVLIASAWEHTQQGDANARPWPWADTKPVARLTVLSDDEHQLIVLEGSSGRNLAFGPTHDPASVLPGERGNSVIAGHRDTHFGFLKDLRVGDRLRADLPNGESHLFTVIDARVADSRYTGIALEADEPHLTLVTCYPFDAIEPGGPLRFVVTANLIAGAGDTPPRQVAHAARSFGVTQ